MTREEAKQECPILDTTYSPKGPLFGSWKTHMAYLRKQEEELKEALSIVRGDIIQVRKRMEGEADDGK